MSTMFDKTARKVLLEHVDAAKREIIAILEDGTREYRKLREAVDRYEELLRASDKLANYPQADAE